jgi:hypothetical protein
LAHLLSACRIELHADAETRRPVALDDATLRDITIGDDDLLVKVNHPVRTSYPRLTQTSGRVIFREPHFKSNGRLQRRASV